MSYNESTLNLQKHSRIVLLKRSLEKLGTTISLCQYNSNKAEQIKSTYIS